jgi:hypothetical protein
MTTTTDILVEELEQLRHELANAKTHITLQESINHLLEQHIASQDTVIQAAREFVLWHQKGQPRTPGTLYPMTYATLDSWHDEWATRLGDLITQVTTLDHASA